MIRLLHRLIGYDDGHVIILYITSEKEEVRRTQPIFFLLVWSASVFFTTRFFSLPCYNAILLHCYNATICPLKVVAAVCHELLVALFRPLPRGR